MIRVRHRGDLKKTKRFLEKISDGNYLKGLEKYGEIGVMALSSATPKDSGLTASSWGYKIEHRMNSFSITWTNSNINKGVNIAIILQYGHGTRNGGYVRGRDYINPAMRPVFDSIADQAWNEVIRS